MCCAATRGAAPPLVALTAAYAPCWCQVVYLNNLGCIYSHLKRDQAAALHFSRALKMCSASSRGQFYASPAGSMLTVRAPSPTCEVFYNAGLSMLRSGQGAAALRCLKRAALLFRHRARLWVRMAEACIVEHEKRRQARRAARDVQSTSWAAAGVVSQVAGRGRTRRMLVECKDDAAEAAAAATGAGDEDCSLAFAAQCLRNCLSLLHDGTAHEAKPEGAEGSSSDAGAHQTSVRREWWPPRGAWFWGCVLTVLWPMLRGVVWVCGCSCSRTGVGRS